MLKQVHKKQALIFIISLLMLNALIPAISPAKSNDGIAVLYTGAVDACIKPVST